MQDRVHIDTPQVKETMEKADISAVSIAYVSKDRPISKIALGCREETIFGVASLSKALFAHIVQMLVGPKNFTLDGTKLNDILSFDEFCKEYNFRWEKTKENIERVKLLTADMVLSHLTGLPNNDENGLLKFQFEPGTRYGYSGIAILYLQKVVEKLSNSSLEELAKKHVFGPFGMKHSSFYPQYELGLMSDKKRDPAKIYLKTTKKGLEYEILGPDRGHPWHSVIPWNKLPKDFPRNSSDIIQSKDKCLPILFKHISKEDYTPASAPNSLQTTAEDYLLFILGWMSRAKLFHEAITSKVSMMKIKPEAGLGFASEEDRKNVAWGLLGLQTDDQGKEVISMFGTGDMNEWRAAFGVSKDGTVIVLLSKGVNGHLLIDQVISPNIELTNAFNFFFQTYPFARKIEELQPDWKKEPRWGIKHQIPEPNDKNVSAKEKLESPLDQSANTAKILANKQTTTAKLMGGVLTHKSSRSPEKSSSNSPPKKEDSQKNKRKPVVSESDIPTERTSKSIHKTPTLKPRGYKS